MPHKLKWLRFMGRAVSGNSIWTASTVAVCIGKKIVNTVLLLVLADSLLKWVMKIQHSRCDTSVRPSAAPALFCWSSFDLPGLRTARNGGDNDLFFSEASKGFWRLGWSLFSACSFGQTCSSSSQLSILTWRWARPEAVNRRLAAQS